MLSVCICISRGILFRVSCLATTTIIAIDRVFTRSDISTYINIQFSTISRTAVNGVPSTNGVPVYEGFFFYFVKLPFIQQRTERTDETTRTKEKAN